jgi:hypothetical protein
LRVAENDQMLGRIFGLEKYGVKNENLILFPRKIMIREIHKSMGY